MNELKLNIGCGTKLLPDFDNLDIAGPEGIIIHDLEKDPLPYEDSTVELIHASHVLEHLHNLIFVMNECYRVLKPGGILHIYVPVYPHVEAFQDPTHVRFFVPETFTYFTKDNPSGGSIGFDGEFTIAGMRKNGFELEVFMEAVK